MAVWSVVLFVIGILSTGYFFLYACLVDLNNVFTFFWLVLGMVGIAGGGTLHWFYCHHRQLPLWCRRGVPIILGIGLLVFLVIEGILIGYGHSRPKPEAEYVIVLGARVKGEVVTANLARRLKTALGYLQENPDTKVILSGGQGSGENISEAEAMKRYLCKQGMDASRMILEDQSVNTDQNLEFSMEKIKHPEAHVVIVSNDFHIFRSVHIARRKGLKNVEGLGSSTVWYTMPNMYVREAVAVVKYMLCGQL